MTTKRKTTPKATKPTDLIKPTREQKLSIIGLLQDVYDTDKQRYKGKDTDQAVAECLEITRWGWVSEIREEFFGPDGNEEDQMSKKLIVLHKELHSLMSKTDKEVESAKEAIKTMILCQTQAKKLMDQVTAWVKAGAP